MDACVVGSGPAGVSVSLALLERGHHVTMLDYGNDISPERSKDVLDLANTDKHLWTSDQINKIKYPVDRNIENKLAYGEDYPYRDGLKLLEIELKNCLVYPSLAAGGLSNAWGGAVLPYNDKDIADWPITSNDLMPYYKKISSILNISTYSSYENKNDLIKDYPLYNDDLCEEGMINTHHISHQAKQLYNQIQKNNSYNTKHHLSIAYARNAFKANKCIDCGLCLWGCPLNLIYNSKQTLNELKLNPRFTYINNVLVKSFQESKNKVEVLAQNKITNQKDLFCANKLFLACGVLSTAKIVLHSFKNYGPIYMSDTPYFIFPVTNFKLSGDYINHRSYNTLSQLFIEINNTSISKNTIHLQVYPYNDIMLDMLERKLGKFFKVLYPVLKALLNKTVTVQGFFHSNEGNKIKIQLQPDDTLIVTGRNHNIKPQIEKVLRVMRKYGVIPTYDIGMPGRSFHYGATFPMLNTPVQAQFDLLTTNRLGLINKTKNTHIVDASIFPSIPAQTIAYTVMANAYRIGAEV